MIDSRLYYNVKKIMHGALNFSYYTAEIDISTSELRSYTKTIHQQDVLSTLDIIGIKNFLFNINEAEFARYLKEVKEYKNYIEELSQTDLSAANMKFAKLWGPNELQRKFTEWFTNNEYDIHKLMIRNEKIPINVLQTKKPDSYLSKLNFKEPFKFMINKMYHYNPIQHVALLTNLITIYYKKFILK